MKSIAKARPAGRGSRQPGKRASEQEITPELCRTVAEASLGHLFKLLKPGGQFIYSHQLGDLTEGGSSYNLLRHCGTVWFMCLAIRGLKIDLSAEQAKALAGAVAFVAKRLRKPPWLENAWPSLGLVTRDSIKLGGVGLALVMLHEFRAVAKENGIATDFFAQDLDLIIAQLENYALLQISNGDFIHKRDFATGKILSFRSDYYTGEALFGLMHASRISSVLRDVMEGLMKRGYGVAIQSHWMAYAACKAAERQLLDPAIVRPFIISLIDQILRNPDYRKRNESTPIACRSEALCCFLLLSRGIRPPSWPFPDELVAQAKTEARENLRLQLQWYDSGQFHRGSESEKVQIDYVQHNGTAFLNWYLLNST